MELKCPAHGLERSRACEGTGGIHLRRIPNELALRAGGPKQRHPLPVFRRSFQTSGLVIDGLRVRPKETLSKGPLLSPTLAQDRLYRARHDSFVQGLEKTLPIWRGSTLSRVLSTSRPAVMMMTEKMGYRIGFARGKCSEKALMDRAYSVYECISSGSLVCLYEEMPERTVSSTRKARSI